MRDKVKLLPSQPGVYLFKDNFGTVLYVGKAIRLKQRVSSYFQKTSNVNINPRLSLLMSKVMDFDWIVTDSELEAFLLEYQLIKRYTPPFNVKFRDDKRYPYIKLVLEDKYPYITVVRGVVKDKNRYFGPYVSSSALRQTLKFIRQVFKIRSCTKKLTGRDRVCLYYHIRECSAPCINAVTAEEYGYTVAEVISFLEGKSAAVIRRLKKTMASSARLFKFEEAARLRDQLNALEQIIEPQKIVTGKKTDKDFIHIAVKEHLACVSLFLLRDGKLLGKEQFILDCEAETDKEKIVVSFLRNYYEGIRQREKVINRKVVVPFVLKEAHFIEKWCKDNLQLVLKIKNPVQIEEKQLLNLVKKNAELYLNQVILKEIRGDLSIIGATELARELHLPKFPMRIEGYDISNLQGMEAVGSMVTFCSGVPQKGDYRRFKIRTKSIPDDYAMLGEVLARRFQAYLNPSGKGSFKELPDLILIDGGKGQLNVALKELEKVGFLEKVTVLALAKGEEELFLPNDSHPLCLPRDSMALKLLQRVRDEAHRFAVSFHRKLRKKQFIKD